MTDQSIPVQNPATAADLRVLKGQVERLHVRTDEQDQRLAKQDEKLDRILTFVDECSGGRKLLLALLKVLGITAGIVTAGTAIVMAAVAIHRGSGHG